MNRKVCLLTILFFSISGFAAAQMVTQISVGADYNFGFLDIDNNFWARTTSPFPSNNMYRDNSSISSRSTGISFAMRLLFDPDPDSFLSTGYFLRSRILLGTHMRKEGTLTTSTDSNSPNSQNNNKNYKLTDGELVLVLTDIGIGTSYIFRPANRFHICFDFGANFSWIQFEDPKIKAEFDYMGLGLITGLSSQVYLTQKVYLDFGLTSTMGIFSNIKGIHVDGSRNVRYSDGGRWDSASVAFFFHVGWRNPLKLPGSS